MKKTLHLTLKKEWFDMIASGEKREEYRAIKSYWIRRILGDKKGQHDKILFKNGYNSQSPQLLIEFKGATIRQGNPEWGAPNEKVIVLTLGKIIKRTNEF